MEATHTSQLERTVSLSMEAEQDDEETRVAFEDVENDEERSEREMELQMKALACGRPLHPSAPVSRPNNAGDESGEAGRPRQPFWGYRYMTPIEFADEEPVTSWTIFRTFEDDTGIHGIGNIGHAIGKTSQFESSDTADRKLYNCSPHKHRNVFDLHNNDKQNRTNTTDRDICN